VARAWRTVARKATPAALYWLVLSLITFLGISAVVRIEATRTRLSLVVAVVGVAFSAACFLERLLRDYVRTEIQPSDELSDARLTVVSPNGCAATKSIRDNNGAPNHELARSKTKKACGVGCLRDATGQGVELIKAIPVAARRRAAWKSARN
jgi:hypothetical protein